MDGHSLNLLFLPNVKDNLTEKTEVLMLRLQLLQKFNEALFNLFSSSTENSFHSAGLSVPCSSYSVQRWPSLLWVGSNVAFGNGAWRSPSFPRRSPETLSIW